MAADSPADVIRTRGLRKVFGLNVVLEAVDLALQRGECLVLLGPNGAGKTTLLKILAALIRPTRGGARVAGFDLLREPVRVRAAVGLLAHGSYLYEDLTARENLHFWATLSGLPGDPHRLGAALASVELDQASDTRVRDFSTGMKRRLALARLLLGDPRLLLLDEPFGGLDQQGKKWLEEFLLSFKGRGGAVLMATHSFGRGLSIADRFTILVGGRIVLDRPRASVDLAELHRLYAVYTEEPE
jgi:heme ABC exporter ATP-binding subunit CcmA